MKEKEMENNLEDSCANNRALIKLNLRGRMRLKLRQVKKEIKSDIHTIIHMDKKELFTKILSSRYFVLLLFIVILLKTILFSADTVFYKEGIWLWYIRQTIFFIILMVSPLLLFRSSRVRFIVRNHFEFIN